MLSNLPPPAQFYVRRLIAKPRTLITLKIGLLLKPAQTNVLYTLKNAHRDANSPHPLWNEPVLAKKISFLRQHSLEKTMPLIASQIDPFWVRLVPTWKFQHGMFRVGYTLESAVMESLLKNVRTLAHGEGYNEEKRYGATAAGGLGSDHGLTVKMISARTQEESIKAVEKLKMEAEGKNGILHAVGMVLRAVEDTRSNDFFSNPRVVMFNGREGEKVRWQRLSEVNFEEETMVDKLPFEGKWPSPGPGTEFLS